MMDAPPPPHTWRFPRSPWLRGAGLVVGKVAEFATAWCGARIHWELRAILKHVDFSRSDGAVFKRISNSWRTCTKFLAAADILPQLRLPSTSRKFAYDFEVHFNPWAEHTVGTEALLHILDFSSRSSKDGATRQSASSFLSSLLRIGLVGDFEFELSAPFEGEEGGERAKVLLIVDDGKVSLNQLLDQANTIVALRPLRRRKSYILRASVGGTMSVEDLLTWLGSEPLQWLRRELISGLALAIEGTIISKGFSSDLVVSGYSVPKRKRSDPLLGDAMAFGKVGDAKVKGRDLMKVTKATTDSSITALPEDQVMRRYFLACRRFFSEVGSLSCAMDGVRVGKVSYLLATVVGRSSQGIAKAALMPPQAPRGSGVPGASASHHPVHREICRIGIAETKPRGLPSSHGEFVFPHDDFVLRCV